MLQRLDHPRPQGRRVPNRDQPLRRHHFRQAPGGGGDDGLFEGERVQHHATHPLFLRGHHEHVSFADQGIRFLYIPQEMHPIAQLLPLDLGFEGTLQLAVPRDGPVEIGGLGARGARGAKQGTVVLVVHERRHVDGERRPGRQPQSRSNVKRARRALADFAWVDAVGDDGNAGGREPVARQHALHAFRHGDDGVGAMPAAAGSHGEIHTAVREQAGRPPAPGARPTRHGEGVAVVHVDDVRSKVRDEPAQPPGGPRIGPTGVRRP